MVPTGLDESRRNAVTHDLGAEADCFGVKIVSKYERAAGDPHGSHVGAVLLFWIGIKLILPQDEDEHETHRRAP